MCLVQGWVRSENDLIARGNMFRLSGRLSKLSGLSVSISEMAHLFFIPSIFQGQ